MENHNLISCGRSSPASLRNLVDLVFSTHPATSSRLGLGMGFKEAVQWNRKTLFWVPLLMLPNLFLAVALSNSWKPTFLTMQNRDNILHFPKLAGGLRKIKKSFVDSNMLSIGGHLSRAPTPQLNTSELFYHQGNAYSFLPYRGAVIWVIKWNVT